MTDETAVTVNPYPGLRPFRFEDKHWFFGREGQSDELLRRLRRARFVAVVGPSGSGKSSLVKAGLLPMLYSGMLTRAGSRWKSMLFRPGDDPIGNLAKEIYTNFGADDAVNKQLDIGLTRATLRRSTLGLVQAIEESTIKEGTNLLVVVDQFEELFRFRELTTGGKTNGNGQSKSADRRISVRRTIDEPPSRFRRQERRVEPERRQDTDAKADQGDFRGHEDQASEFVKLLLTATTQREVPIYVMITMRSDYLGDCAQFRGLPEAINKSEYLIPRLTRDQQALAIRGPAAVEDVRLTDRLVQRLLNDVGEDQDQLPLLQHALMRMWEHRDPLNLQGPDLDLGDYRKVGKVEEALNEHAEEAFDELSDEHKEIARRIFQVITKKDTNGRAIRNPAKFRRICAITGATEQQVTDVIKVFRKSPRSFLWATIPEDEGEDPVIDIAHESLIRKWHRLLDWVDQESKWADAYKELQKEALEYNAGRGQLWSDAKLDLAEEWWRQANPTPEWASRYGAHHKEAQSFLDASVKAREDKAEQVKLAEARERFNDRFKIISVSVGLFVLSTAAILLWFMNADRKAAARDLSSVDLKRGAAFIENNQVEEGLAHLARALRRDPENVGAAAHVANTLLSRNWAVPVAETNIDAVIENTVFLENGKSVVLQSEAGLEVWRWDDESGRGTRTVSLPMNRAVSAAGVTLGPDSGLVVTTSSDGFAHVWSSDGTVLGSFSHEKFPDADSIIPSGIRSLDISNDGRFLATGADDGIVRLWNLNTSTSPDTLHFLEPISFVKFNPTADTLLSLANDGEIVVWSHQTGGVRTVAAGDEFDPVGAYAVDHVGRRVFTSQAFAGWRVHDAVDSTGGVSLGRHNPVTHAAFSRDGSLVATATGSRVLVLNAMTGALEDSLETTTRISSIASGFSRLRLAAVLADSTVSVWQNDSVAVGKVAFEPTRQTIRHGAEITRAAFLPDNEQLVNLLVVSRDGAARIWDLGDRWKSPIQLKHNGGVRYSKFSPDGRSIITVSMDSTARVWNSWTGGVIDSFRVITDVQTDARGQSADSAIGAVATAFSPDGDRVVTTAEDGSVTIWNLESPFDTVTTSPKHAGTVRYVEFNSEGTSVVSASDDGTAVLWNASTGRQEKVLSHGARVRVAKFFPDDDDRILTASDDGTAMLWDRSLADTALWSVRHDVRVHDAAISSDGRFVVTGSWDHTAKVWDVASGSHVLTLPHSAPVRVVSFSPDDQHILTVASQVAQVWRASDGEPIGVAMAHQTDIFYARFSRDNQLVLTTSNDGTARIWRAASGQPVSEPIRHAGRVRSADFDPSGYRVATASYDSTARISVVNIDVRSDAQWLGLLAESLGGYTLSENSFFAPSVNRVANVERVRDGAAGNCRDMIGVRHFACWFLFRENPGERPGFPIPDNTNADQGRE